MPWPLRPPGGPACFSALTAVGFGAVLRCCVVSRGALEEEEENEEEEDEEEEEEEEEAEG